MKNKLQTANFSLASLQLEQLSVSDEFKLLQVEIKNLLKSKEKLNQELSTAQNSNHFLIQQEARIKSFNDALQVENKDLNEKLKQNERDKSEEQRSIILRNDEQMKQIDHLNDSLKNLKKASNDEKLAYETSLNDLNRKQKIDFDLIKSDENKLKTLKRDYFILSSKNILKPKILAKSKRGCSVPGCNGFGNSRYPKAKNHYSLESCPNAQNFQPNISSAMPNICDDTSFKFEAKVSNVENQFETSLESLRKKV